MQPRPQARNARLLPGPRWLYIAAFALLIALLEVFMRYARYVSVLRWLTLSLFAYVATVFAVGVPWQTVALNLVVPHIEWTGSYITVLVAVFGTTISPYLFFWQASQEAEESHLSFRHGTRRLPKLSKNAFRHIAVDTMTGMVMSNLIAFFIIVTTAATLHAHGVTKIDTAAQAAEALRPIAGPFTFLLFSAGIIGTGLLAVPVLAGSAAYAVAETFHMRGSLELPANRAIGFYAIVSAATLAGAALTLTSIDPIAMLFWTAVINGVVAVPIMAVMMIVVWRQGKGPTLPAWLVVLGWLATALMAVTVGLLGWSSFA